jgi:hypothetical protein
MSIWIKQKVLEVIKSSQVATHFYYFGMMAKSSVIYDIISTYIWFNITMNEPVSMTGLDSEYHLMIIRDTVRSL